MSSGHAGEALTHCRTLLLMLLAVPGGLVLVVRLQGAPAPLPGLGRRTHHVDAVVHRLARGVVDVGEAELRAQVRDVDAASAQARRPAGRQVVTAELRRGRHGAREQVAGVGQGRRQVEGRGQAPVVLDVAERLRRSPA